MKVCLCVANFKPDLAEAISKTSVAMAKRLDEQGECTLAVAGDVSAFADRAGTLKCVSFAPERDYASKIRVLLNIIDMGRHFRRSNETFDVVHFQMGNLLELFLVWLFVPRMDSVRVASVWQPYMGVREFFRLPALFRHNLRRILHHYLFNAFLHMPLFLVGRTYFDKIVVHSDVQRRQIAFPGDEKVTVIANGVAPVEPGAAVANSVPRILYVGHATEVKGLDVLLPALATASEKVDFQVTLALSSFHNVDLEQIIRRNGLKDLISLKGNVDVYAEMRAHDLFVLPHKTSLGTSCYPNVVLESFATGLPIVVSATDVLAELVRDGETGVVVRPCDPGALAGAIIRLLADPEAREKMSRRQLETFRERFSLEKMVAAHFNLYDNLLNSRRPRSPA